MTAINLTRRFPRATWLPNTKPGDFVEVHGSYSDLDTWWVLPVSHSDEDGTIGDIVPAPPRDAQLASVQPRPTTIQPGDPMSKITAASVGRTVTIRWSWPDGRGYMAKGTVTKVREDAVMVGGKWFYRSAGLDRSLGFRKITQTGGI